MHAAADGGLARVRVPGGRLRGDQLAALAGAAAELGDGGLELTSRGNVQIRGLAPDAGAGLAARLRAAGLLPSETHERVRNVVASPLSGRDGAGHLDVRLLVPALDSGLCGDPALAALPGRFLFAVDDGRGDVAGLGADVALLGASPDAVALLLGGVDSGVRVPPRSAAAAALVAARAFLAERAAQESQVWRLAELRDSAVRVTARIRTALPSVPPPGDPVRVPPAVPPPVGPVAQRDGRTALAVAVPLGRLRGPQALALHAAARAGADEMYVTPWRTAVVPDIAAGEADRWARELRAAGLVTDAASPWVGVSACAGRPGCAKALADVRADAAAAVAVAPPGAPAILVHWVGCERRCGRPAGPHLEVLATPHGYETRRIA